MKQMKLTKKRNKLLRAFMKTSQHKTENMNTITE